MATAQHSLPSDLRQLLPVLLNVWPRSITHEVGLRPAARQFFQGRGRLARGFPRPGEVTGSRVGALFCLVLGWMAEAARTPLLRSVRTLGVSYVLASFAGLGLTFLLIPWSAKYKIDVRGGVLRTPAPIDSLEYIRNRVTPGEKILVYPYQPLYYYLTGTYSVSKYDRILVGTYEPSQFQEMASELAAAKPRVVLLDPFFTEFIPPMCPNIAVEALAAKDPVEDYIFANYHSCRVFGEPTARWHVVVMMRDDLACSAQGTGNISSGDARR